MTEIDARLARLSGDIRQFAGKHRLVSDMPLRAHREPEDFKAFEARMHVRMFIGLTVWHALPIFGSAESWWLGAWALITGFCLLPIIWVALAFHLLKGNPPE